MVDTGSEVDLWWLEGIVCGEVDGQEEDAALEWTVTLGTVSGVFVCRNLDLAYGAHDGCLPVKLFVSLVHARFRTHSAFGLPEQTWMSRIVTYQIVPYRTC